MKQNPQGRPASTALSDVTPIMKFLTSPHFENRLSNYASVVCVERLPIYRVVDFNSFSLYSSSERPDLQS